MKTLERTVANTCYSPKNDFTFLEAQKCEEFHYKNDYKLNAIDSFATDYSNRLLNEYQTCVDDSSALNNNADKDRAYLSCHNNWVHSLKQEMTPSLEAKALDLFK